MPVGDRCELEVEFVLRPGEAQAPWRVEGENDARRVVGVGISGEGDDAARPGLISTEDGNQCASSSGSLTAAQTRSTECA